MTNQKQQFGTWLKEQRNACQLSQRELAEQLGVHYTYISKIENGNIATMPSHDVYTSLSFIFGVPLDEIEDVAGYYDETYVKHNIGVKPELARQLRKLYEPKAE